MRFSKKTCISPSSPTDSNTTKEDQEEEGEESPDDQHRNIPSGLSIFSEILNALESSPIIITTNTTDSIETHNDRNADDRMGLFRIGGGRKRSYEMCAEILGFESLVEKMDGGDRLMLESESPLRSNSRMGVCGTVKAKTNLNDFPPLLSMLDESGRPRFDFKKVRSNGLLEMQMVRNDKPGILRTRGRDGGLRMEMVNAEPEY